MCFQIGDSVEDFNIELAGIPLNIRYNYEENKTFFDQYFTTNNPVFSVEPTDRIIESVQKDFDILNESESNPKICYSKSFLENNAIHILIADKLIDYNVLMLHGSALSIDGKGIIFTAKSGTGKSTHSKLWREVFGSRVQMINDDKPLIRVDTMEVYGTPWNGKHHLSTNTSAPLNAIVKIERALNNKIIPIDTKNALSLLMERTHVPTDPGKRAFIMTLYLKLIKNIPFYKLECNMDPDAVRVAYNTLIGKSS